MKSISNILENIDGISSFYNVGLLIFLTVFIIILVRTVRMPKKEAEKIKNSILD